MGIHREASCPSAEARHAVKVLVQLLAVRLGLEPARRAEAAAQILQVMGDKLPLVDSEAGASWLAQRIEEFLPRGLAGPADALVALFSEHSAPPSPSPSPKQPSSPQ